MKIDNSLDFQIQPLSSSENKVNDNQEVSFSQFLKNSIYSVSELQDEAAEKNLQFITGDVENVHDVMIASQKADVALQAFIEVKNKVVDAYKEIMRMQI